MARRSLPPLSTLKAFEAAARLSSFKLAAEELSVTQSAVSHQVASLERHLGVSLFERLPGRVVLGEKGQIYFPVVQEALDRIALTTELIRERGTTASLTVQVYVTVAVRWLIPKLQQFNDAWPDIPIRLDAGLLDWEFNPDRADVGLIYTCNPDKPNISYTLLRRERLVAVCASVLAKEIRSPDDLRRLTLLSVSGTTEDAALWAESVGLSNFVPLTAPIFDSNLLAIEAAISGHGVVIVPEFLIRNDLTEERLVMPIASTVFQSGGWYLAHLKTRQNEKAIRNFLNWILDQSE